MFFETSSGNDEVIAKSYEQGVGAGFYATLMHVSIGSPTMPVKNVKDIITVAKDMAMGQSLWYHIWVDEHPFTCYFDVHQGYRVLTHTHIPKIYQNSCW